MLYCIFNIYTGFSLALAVFYFPMAVVIIGRLDNKFHWVGMALSTWAFTFMLLAYFVIAGFVRERYAPQDPISFFISLSLFLGFILGILTVARFWKLCVSIRSFG